MKSSGHTSVYFSPHAPKARKQEPLAAATHQSPYLRAVLSDKRAPGPAKVLSLTNTSMAAALRYIANSK
jgi:hypothetical protein